MNSNQLSRRDLLSAIPFGLGQLAALSFGGAALTNCSTAVADETNGKASGPLAPKMPHFAAKAKRVIFLCMRGGPSHLDTFDYKPQLAKDHGKDSKYQGTLLGSPFPFKQRGQSGLWISDLFPHVSAMADDMCLIRGMKTDQPIHPRAMTQMHTGNAQFVRPSLGAWSLYGLGSENDSMPGFVSVNPVAGTAQNYGSSFLPAIYQGTRLNHSTSSGDRRRGPDSGQTIPDIKSPRLIDRDQRQQLNFTQELNRQKLGSEQHQPGVEGVIESLELAFRMQKELPKIMDTSQEDLKTLQMYGIGQSDTDSFGKQCLLARKLSESGVRFVEITHADWDTHFDMKTKLPMLSKQTDKPIAGLLADLKRRGMLKDTLVIWAGEFGRTPYGQNDDGRDHNNKGYTTWMAGGGVKGGFSYGATDEHGYEAVENICHIHDWHATILHLLGLDHERLTFKHAGRDFRLTDVHGTVAKDIIA
jgi:hypothetical protein